MLEVQSRKELGEKEEKEGEGGGRGERKRMEERMKAKKKPACCYCSLPQAKQTSHVFYLLGISQPFPISSMTIFSLNMPLSTFVNHSLIPDRHSLGMAKGKRSVRAEAYSQRTLSLPEKWRHILSKYNSKCPKKNVLLTFRRRSKIFIKFL